MGIIKYLNTDPTLFIALLICLIFSLCFHEYAHGVVAYYLGDDTAYKMGRLTLNPIAHLDPIGSLMILFIGIGPSSKASIITLKRFKESVMPFLVTNFKLSLSVWYSLNSPNLLLQKVEYGRSIFGKQYCFSSEPLFKKL